MNYRILIADDEPLEREALAEIVHRHPDLRIAGVELASTGQEAMEKAAVNPPDIAVLDIKMPGADGLEVARFIKQSHPDTRLVFLTAFDYFDYAREAVRVHADDFIVKPAEDDYVVRLLSRLVTSLDRRLEQESVVQNQESRLQAVTEFVQSELLDHLVAGDPDLQIINRGLEFLGRGTAQFAARAITIRFSFERYPLAVRTAAQQRALVSRAVRGAVQHMEHTGGTVLARTDADVAHLLWIFAREGSDSAAEADVETWLPGELSDLGSQNQLCLAAGVSRLCTSAVELAAAFPQARAAASDALDDSEPGTGEVRRWSTVRFYLASGGAVHTTLIPSEWESRLLAGLGRDDKDEIDRLCERVCAHLSTAVHDGTVTVREASRELESLLRFLDRSLRVRGKLDGAPPVNAELEHLGWVPVCRRFQEILLSFVAVEAPSPSGTVRRLAEYVDRNYMNHISLNDLARHVQISSTHCSRIFSKELGRPFQQYVTHRRIQAAQQLLEETSLSVGEIAERVGFSDPNYFTRLFSREVGVSPRVYREQVL